MIKKKCSHITCNELIPRRKQPPYCEYHTTVVKGERNKSYNSKRDQEIEKFYKSRSWQRFRKTVLAEHHYLCSVCSNAGNVVHHKIEVKEDWSKRLDRNNVTVVCNACHNKIHDRFSKKRIP